MSPDCCVRPTPEFQEFVAVKGALTEVPAGAMDGLNHCFQLSQVPAIQAVLVKHGIRFLDYNPVPNATEYSVNGRCLWLGRAPMPGDALLVKYYPQGDPVALGTPPSWPLVPLGLGGVDPPSPRILGP